MSNIATVQSIYEAFGRGDIPGILDRTADDVEWESWGVPNSAQEADVPWMRRLNGRDGVAAFFAAVAEGLEFHSFQPTNLLEGPNQVAATISLEATAKATGERFQEEEMHLWTFDAEGHVAHFRHYLDTAKHIRVAKGAAATVA